MFGCYINDLLERLDGLYTASKEGRTIFLWGKKYIPERTCSLVECEGPTPFYDEYDDGCYYMGCSKCGAGMSNDANFCQHCGAKVVDE